MTRKSKIVIFAIMFFLVLVLALVFYLFQYDWVNIGGWQGEYNEDSVYLNGVEAMEYDCSVNTRIQYSYYVEAGEIELKVTRDRDGKDVVKLLNIAKTCDGTITFENEDQETYYIFETAADGTVSSGGCGIQERLSKWEQYLRSKEAEKEYNRLFQSQQ